MHMKRRVQFAGQECEATVVPIEESIERWSEVKLEDGAELGIKPVPTEVVRLEGMQNSEAVPVYRIKSASIVTVAAPSELRGAIRLSGNGVH